MGKKRDLANKNIVDLVYNLVGYMKGYVGSCNCPYTYKLLGAENFTKPKDCHVLGCETCKEDFYTALTSELLDRNVVE